MNKPEKILISGTGRCGTTFLIKLFSFMGMDTGYNLGNYYNHISKNCNAGMEKTISATNYVLKNPQFIGIIDDIIKKVTIKHMIIPIRDFEVAARSRARYGKGNGGFRDAHDVKSQITCYHKLMANYLHDMVKYNIPTIFLDFDKMIKDKDYLHNKLIQILKGHNISKDVFNNAYDIASQSSKPSKTTNIIPLCVDKPKQTNIIPLCVDKPKQTNIIKEEKEEKETVNKSTKRYLSQL